MKEIWDLATNGQVLPFTLLLIPVALYWLLALLGTLDLDFLDVVGAVLKMHPSIRKRFRLSNTPTFRNDSAFAEWHFILLWTRIANFAESGMSELFISLGGAIGTS